MFFCFVIGVYCNYLICSDKRSNASVLHLVHNILGVALLTYWVITFQKSFEEWKQVELIGLVVLSVVSSVLVWIYRGSIQGPVTEAEIGKDYDFAARSEQLQWELVKAKKSKIN
jgi:hypothetical protein